MKNISLFDDSRRIRGSNLQQAAASTFSDAINVLDGIACRYRPIFNFWGGCKAVGTWPAPTFRQSWANLSPASSGITMSFGAVPSHHQSVTGQGIATTVAGADAGTHGSWNTQWSETVPIYPTEIFEPVAARTNVARDGAVKEIAFGSSTANGPQVRSGVIFERINDTPAVSAPTTTQTVPTDWVAPGSPIIGRRAGGNYLSMRGYRDFFRSVYKQRRLAFGWSSAMIGSTPGASGPISMGGSTYSYLFDQTIGQSLVAPTPTGPGITVPLRYSAAGRGTTVRLYIRIYAAMSAGGTGSFQFYNRSGGGMSGLTAMTNPITVTGTTFAWYGCAAGTTFSEANDTWFAGNAALPYDRIVLCGKPTAGSLYVGAFSIHAYHGTL